MIVLLLTVYGANAEQPESITICTPEWEYYTQKDGKGLYHDLWKEIFPPAGIRLAIRYAPYKRCEKMMKEYQTEKYDA